MAVHQTVRSDLDSMEARYNTILPGLGLSRFAIWLGIFSALLPFVLVAAAAVLDILVKLVVVAGAPVRSLSITDSAVAQLAQQLGSWSALFRDPRDHAETWLLAAVALLTALYSNRSTFPLLFVAFWVVAQLLVIAAQAFQAWLHWPAVAALISRNKAFSDGPALQSFISSACRMIVLVWLAAVMATQFGTARRLDAQARAAIADIGPGQRIGWHDAVLLFGLPPNLRHSARKVLTSLFGIIGNFTIMIPFVIAASIAIPIYVLVLALEPYVHPGFAHLAAPYGIGHVEAAVFIVIILTLSIAIFQTLLRASRNYLHHSVEALQVKDPRHPILFLRSFLDDAVTLPCPRLFPLGWVFDISRAIPNLELIVLKEATPLGPAVALGDPKDKIPPYGIARGYFKNNSWKDGVTKLALDATIIVIAIDETPGVIFEVEELILGKGLADKTLFLVHPKFQKRPEAPQLQAMLGKIVAALASGHDSAAPDFRRSIPLAIYNDRQTGRLQVLYSSTFSWTAYFLTVRRYVRDAGVSASAARSLTGCG